MVLSNGTKVAPTLSTYGLEPGKIGFIGLLGKQPSLVLPGAPASPLDAKMVVPLREILRYSLFTLSYLREF